MKQRIERGRRGVDDGVATLAAQVGMAAFGYAVSAWFNDPSTGLDAHLARAFDALHTLSLTPPRPGPEVR